MLKQLNAYGCGLYSVANSLNLKAFVTEKRLEESKEGNNIGQLSKYLQEDGNDVYIEVLYYNHLGKKLPNSALSYVPIGENCNFLPILINVRYSENGKNHLVGGKIHKDGTLYLYDSLKDSVIETTLKEVNKMYHHVYGLFVFNSLNDKGYVFI